ncbi:hypothetical protein HKX48_001630 [Thoreauomyces humboldtii]|nr:hypothetical protein HKX48_001630 [Thoreauomyces humboldtii]
MTRFVALFLASLAAARPVQDFSFLSSSQYIAVDGSGTPLLYDLTASQSFNQSLPSTSFASSPWTSINEIASPSFYGVAALPDGQVVLADTQSNTVHLADMQAMSRKLLYDPSLLQQFVNGTSTATASQAVKINGIIRTSREGNGDVLFIGLDNQVFRVPASRPGVPALGDRVEMLADGFGMYQVFDICQWDNRVIISLVQCNTSMTTASVTMSNAQPTETLTPFTSLYKRVVASTPTITAPPTSPSPAKTAAARPGSQAIVIRYNAWPDTETVLSDPRIVRRVQTGADRGSPGMKLDCDSSAIYISDRSQLAIHDLVTGTEHRPAINHDVDHPTAVAVRNGTSVVITGTCGGVWCSREVPWSEASFRKSVTEAS